jgi:hypothetical protein
LVPQRTQALRIVPPITEPVIAIADGKVLGNSRFITVQRRSQLQGARSQSNVPGPLEGATGLHRLLWPMGCWSHLPDPWRSRQSALVLVDARHRPHDARGSGGDPRRGQGAISEELGRLEGVGEGGRGAVAGRATRDAKRPEDHALGFSMTLEQSHFGQTCPSSEILRQEAS